MRPLSVNKLYRNFRGRTIKSQEGREYEMAFNHYLAEFGTQAIRFLEEFDKNQHAVHIEYVFYLESSKYLTKSGRINMRCLDVDNGIKQAQDNLFRFLQIDDGFVTKVTATKVPSDADCIEIVVRRVNQVSKILSPEPRAQIGSDSLQ
jgi:Holliday junction resolvase RusA-like endonuclease